MISELLLSLLFLLLSKLIFPATKSLSQHCGRLSDATDVIECMKVHETTDRKTDLRGKQFGNFITTKWPGGDQEPGLFVVKN